MEIGEYIHPYACIAAAAPDSRILPVDQQPRVGVFPHPVPQLLRRDELGGGLQACQGHRVHKHNDPNHHNEDERRLRRVARAFGIRVQVRREFVRGGRAACAQHHGEADDREYGLQPKICTHTSASQSPRSARTHTYIDPISFHPPCARTCVILITNADQPPPQNGPSQDVDKDGDEDDSRPAPSTLGKGS